MPRRQPDRNHSPAGRRSRAGTRRIAVQVPPDDPGNPQLGGDGPPAPAPEAGSRVVEVQFRAAATAQAAALAGGVQALAQAAISGAAPPETLTPVQAVLLRNRVEASAPSFSERHLQAEAARFAAAAVAGAAASPDPLANQPSLQSFVRFQFASPAEAAAAARELAALPDVEKAVPVPTAAPPQAVAAPSDPLIGSAGQGITVEPASGLEPQWYLHRTAVPDAWALGARGQGVVIADVDWGYRISHQDLAGRLELEHAFNAVDGSQAVSQGAFTSHGTAVMGIAGAAADGRGMAGYAPEAALWPIQANSPDQNVVAPDHWANAVEHVRCADSQGRRKVIVLEVQTGKPWLGNYEQMPSVHAAIRRAIADNVVVCVAAGNGNRAADLDDNGRPIEPTGSILVGATAWHPTENHRARFSNWGSRIVVSAPGDDLHDLTCAATGDDAYRNGFGGTSGATPKVAGVAALMLSVNPHLTHDDVREILRGTGAEIAPDPMPERRIGVFLDAEAAVAEALRRAGIDAPGGGVLPAAVRIEGMSRQAPVAPRRAARTDGELAFGVSATPVPDRTLREFRQSTQGLMTREQQLLVVDQAEKLLDLFYVHRPLKEAMHAVRPIQRLRVIRRRLEEEPAGWTGKDELRLHNLLTEVFISVRDLHTNYLLPQPYRDYTAFLPFLVRPYYDADGQRRYMVTQVTQGIRFADDQFRPGVEVLSWNGVAIETAVDLSAQQTAGSNLSARFVRGVDALTLRPLNVALPPEADWVHVGFRTKDGQEHLMRQDWLVRFTPPADAGAASGSASLENLASLGIDIAADAVREVKQLIFTPETVFAASARARTRSAEANPLANEDVPSHLPLVFEARRFAVDAREWAYIRIRTFAVFDPDAFVQEFMRLAALLPPDGLILDVRGNGGGHIFAAERLLQVLTPNRIEPERLQFISTPGTLTLCRRNLSGPIDLSPWVGSLEQAVLTGATYSQALPITDPESCNAIGQRYHGPVVLLIDGRCYSATDIFAAGFQDHGIGLVVGTSANTGAGGANVWGHDLLQALYAGEGSPLQPLPLKMGMRVAIRQTLRVGARAGTLLEDFGVSPRADLLHRTTERDLLQHDAELIEFAARQLAQQPVFRIGLRETGRADGLVQLQAECQGISRLDVYLSGHPRDSIAVAPGDTPPFSITPGTRVELRGFAVDAQIGQERCVAALKELIT